MADPKSPEPAALDRLRADPKFSSFESAVNAIFDNRVSDLKKARSRKKDQDPTPEDRSFLDDALNFFDAKNGPDEGGTP